MDKETIKKLALDLMFEISDEEAKDISNDFLVLNELLTFFDCIDTDNVEEMVYPYEIETSYLRIDEEKNKISQEEAIKNAPKSRQGHVEIPKVLK